MVSKSISSPEVFQINDAKSGMISFGCNQDWYSTEWQRKSGCGPTVATNIILYLTKRMGNDERSDVSDNKQKILVIMEEMWEHITPTNKGINTLKLFYDGMMSYAKSSELKLCYHFCDVNRKNILCPKLFNVIKFIEKGLAIDVPVAFLNLDSGEEKNIEKWHWVTIIRMKYSENREEVCIEIIDNNEVKWINLSLWYNTTSIGGGFVYFSKC